MASKLNEGKIMQALNWAYDKALDEPFREQTLLMRWLKTT